MGVRKIEVLRAAWGAALLFAPGLVLRDVHRVRVDAKSVVIARILGARHLIQAVLSGVSPSPEVLAIGVWVDVAHASTALGLAAADRSRARAGLTDTAIAGTFASLGYRDLSMSYAGPTGHDRRRDALARWTLRHLPGGGQLLHIAATREETP
ncbi:MAG: hypothetical protein DLM57_01115 [Pseudonocardiales bacterium]|nr:MAG: hypothetical protein DLM57_01115 [Pseudonocardiales bacterium]